MKVVEARWWVDCNKIRIAIMRLNMRGGGRSAFWESGVIFSNSETAIEFGSSC